jgi:hypothetical protein
VNSSYIYIQTERNPALFTVGFYRPDGRWEGDSDHSDREEAADRVHWLNGGEKETQVDNKIFNEIKEAFNQLNDESKKLAKRISNLEAETETEFQKARRIMGETLLRKDEGLYISYRANVAMLLYDEQKKNGSCLIDFTEPECRNKIADRILNLIFKETSNG